MEMLSTSIEIKVKEAGRKWESIKASEISLLTVNLTPYEIAKAISAHNSAEVRWNWQGSPQGHYVTAFC